MRKEQIKKIKQKYYFGELENIIFSHLINQMRQFNKEGSRVYRTTAILNKVKKNDKYIYKKIAFRYMTFSNIEYLKKTYFNPNQNYISHIDNNSNLYLSVARVFQLPILSFNPKKRKEQSKKLLSENKFIKYIYRYDIFIDFDCNNKKDITRMIYDIKKVIEVIIFFKLQAEICFSGTRGFKILILNNCYNYNIVKKIISSIPKRLNIEKTCDSIGSTIPSKLMKCTASLVYDYKKNIFNIALPIHENNYKIVFNKILKDNNFSIFEYKNKLSPIQKILLSCENLFFINNYTINGLKNFVETIIKK